MLIPSSTPTPNKNTPIPIKSLVLSPMGPILYEEYMHLYNVVIK